MPSVKLLDREPATTDGHITTIDGVDGYFYSFSGVEWNRDEVPWTDGLQNIERPIMGKTRFADVTLEREFDPEKDDSFLEWVEGLRCTTAGIDIAIRLVDRCQGEIIQRSRNAWRLNGCRLKTFRTLDSIHFLENQLNFRVCQLRRNDG